MGNGATESGGLGLGDVFPGGFPGSEPGAGTWYKGRHRQVEPDRVSIGIVQIHIVSIPLTFRNPDHEGVDLLAAAGTLWMRTFCERAASLGHFHHESIEMLAF